jgi:hypothetical protein
LKLPSEPFFKKINVSIKLSILRIAKVLKLRIEQGPGKEVLDVLSLYVVTISIEEPLGHVAIAVGNSVKAFGDQFLALPFAELG